MSTLADRLLEARTDANMTQPQLAKRSGVKNQSTIGMLESGARKKSSYIPKIAEALGIEALWLAEGRGPKRRGDSVTASPSIQLIHDARTPKREVAHDENEEALLRGYRDASEDIRESLLMQALKATEKKNAFYGRNEKK